MKLIIEIDGPVLDVAPVWYRVHREVAAELDWSTLDQGTFWRQTRKLGREMTPLPGARPVKIKQYFARFDERIEAEEILSECHPHDAVDASLASLATRGTIVFVTLGPNVQARRDTLERHRVLRFATRTEGLNADPRRRPGELRALAGDDRRTLVAAASDSIIRAAGEAGLVTVGIPGGPCNADRLYRAGADVVYKDLEQLRSAIAEGSEELIRAGLLPPTLG
ncbi:MAG: hypothetical protein PVI86_10395 [Phycisphaerae bacterium]|jgi:phosphoglycolate phosphatase-like HAD superfamily hydrolase